MNKSKIIDLGAAEKKVKANLKSVNDTAINVINNTCEDIKFILDRAEGCVSDFDSIRNRIANRTSEYQAVITNEVIDSYIEVFDMVWERVGGKLHRKIYPRIFQLINPKEAVWEGRGSENMQEIDINTITFPADRTPFVFIHGIENEPTKEAAYEFYEKFENAARMYNNDITDYSKDTDVFIVSYDSTLSNDEEVIIRAGFETVLGGTVTGDAPEFFAAVMWREWQKRAIYTGEEVLLPFLKKMADSNIDRTKRGKVISHSLGCLVMAHAAEELKKQFPDSEKPLNSWLVLAAALPLNAFANTGDYKNAPAVTGVYDSDPLYGTKVWFSYVDFALLFFYVYATKHEAMGQRGSVFPARYEVFNQDVTFCTLESHTADEYFARLASTLRFYLNTEIWSEQPRCSISVPPFS
ncbi:hypothetical protein G9F71_008575 [Clostridium sp. FP2]|uniref:hypothetical protein n=1 Tax=Clostridium sp. FP2 TaxID=2724481 RepID=UPI0013E8F908|nr:hypothetical protein [Clostridium sp. FP2]MBZ9622907.1 hypothetical protein [Clostridium sp. FP2]